MSGPEPDRRPAGVGRVRLRWPGASEDEDRGHEVRGRSLAEAPAPARREVSDRSGTPEGADELAAVRRTVEELRGEVAGLREELAALHAEVARVRRRLPLRAEPR